MFLGLLVTCDLKNDPQVSYGLADHVLVPYHVKIVCAGYDECTRVNARTAKS